MPASDSSIRPEGAELLVQAILMLEYGVITSRASRNMPGYDVSAHNLEEKVDCQISIKYRKAAEWDGFQSPEWTISTSLQASSDTEEKSDEPAQPKMP